MASSFRDVSWSLTTTRHSRQESSGRVISSSQRPLPDNTQQTNIHASGGIRTHDRSRRAAVNLRLRARGHWDRHWEVGWRWINGGNMADGVACGRNDLNLANMGAVSLSNSRSQSSSTSHLTARFGRDPIEKGLARNRVGRDAVGSSGRLCQTR
jgi:hypothetical protein